MVFINHAIGEIQCKIVYFGPGLSGKTTNLEMVHKKAPDEAKGELTSIATESDRTLFFDFMPLNLGTVGGMKTKFQLYTVPGQVYYNSTRKLVLRGADGVIFVADSAPDKMEENLESLANLEECLQEQGKSLAEFPHAIQFNKRDLPEVVPFDEMERILNKHGAPCFEGVANKGTGVIETFKALSSSVIDKVREMTGRPSTGTMRRPEAAAPRPAAEPAAAPGGGGGMSIERNSPVMPQSGGRQASAPAAQSNPAPQSGIGVAEAPTPAPAASAAAARLGESGKMRSTLSSSGATRSVSEHSQARMVVGSRSPSKAKSSGGAGLWIALGVLIAGGLAYVLLG